MPWTIRSGDVDLVDLVGCDACHGHPHGNGNGTGTCAACGAILVCADPPPRKVYRLTLIPCDDDLRPLPGRQRRSIRVEWGERVQADGTVARVYRLIDKYNDRYVERITRDDGTVFERDEPLRRHRGHGSARIQQARDRQIRGRRQWRDI